MLNVFLLIALLLSGIAALLYFAPERKILNFVDYEGGLSRARINRHAATRLLLPVCVSLACAYIAGVRPELTVPLLFPTMISILAAVVWIAAGLARLASEQP